jgi:tRNA G18 (ribose-2'-O)-methylase SpoU
MSNDNERGDKTRRDRYKEKLKDAKTFPISITTVNFQHEVNLAYVVRSAVCFGAEEVCVIGSYPSRKLMNELSGSLFDYMKVRAFPNPSDYLRYAEKNDINLVSIELPPDGFEYHSILDYEFDFSKRLCLIVGHETLGVPVEILAKSDIIFIPMDGAGFCLNTAQAANIALYEVTKRYKEQERYFADVREDF